jgi:poly(3-hydroxybutyrate) depolymerase
MPVGAGGTGGGEPAPAPALDAAALDSAPTPENPDAAPAPPAGAASPLCASGAPTPAPDGYQTIMAGGKMRKFLLRAPKSYDGKKALALIFAMHGGGANGASFETRITAIRQAIGERAIFVYPDGLAPPGGGMITWARDYKDDLAFVDAILAWLKDKTCYDGARVFALGQSSGAYFVHTMGCHRAGVIRAVASNGGGVRPEEFMGCNGQPVAAWVSNGGMDTAHLPDAKAARDAWVKINGCAVANPTKTTPDPCVSYTGCKSGFPVHYCQNGGGHDLPPYAPMGMAEFFFGNFDH